MADGKVVISTELDNSCIPAGIKAIKGALGGLTGVVNKLGMAIGIAFSVGAIVQFGKESVNAANELSSALTGLQSIMDGQGRSFSAAQKFIEGYTKDGLIPATNAITAYKNLAMRGYDDSQIQRVMVALKDASAFGRQASYSMGEAVQTATEGLKNENSILVDNAGVTKNVAKMWEEYAASIGTTSNNLTQQQKIQAEVNGILEESKYQVGDAARVAGTLTGQITQLSFNFNNLKVAVGNAINPIVQSFLPVINAAVQALTRFANAVASVIGAIFGKASVRTSALADSNNAVASSASAGAGAEEELADATKAAGKAAQKSLAPFDELNKLQSNSGGGSSSGPSAGGAGGAVSTSIEADAQVEDSISPKLQAVVDKINEFVDPLKNIDFSPAVAAFERLKGAIAPLTEKLFEGLEWAWYNILVPLAEWTIEDVLPAFLDVLSGLLSRLNSVVDALQPLGIWLWENFLKPLAEWRGGIVVDVLNSIADALFNVSDWISQNQETVQAIAIAVGSFAAAWALVNGAIAIWNTIAGVATAVTTAFGAAVAFLTSPIGIVVAAIAAIIAIVVLLVKNWNAVKETALNVWKAIKTAWSVVANWFDKNVIQPVASCFSGLWETISSLASDAWESIKGFFSPAIEWFSELWGSVSQTFSDIFYNIGVIASGCWEIIKAVWGIVSDWFDQNVVSPVSDFFTGMWEGLKKGAQEAWEGVKSAFSTVASFFQDIFSSAWESVVKVFSPLGEIFVNIKDGILTAFKQIVNGIIRGLNSVISVPFEGINSALRTIKNIKILNLTPFSRLRTISVPQIPYLAQGAVIPPNREFMAVLGDQKHGTNIEAPLETIQEAVALVMDDFISSNMAGQEAVVAVLRDILQAVLGIQIGDDVIGEAVTRYQQKMAVVKGY